MKQNKMTRSVELKIRKLAQDLADFRASSGKKWAHPLASHWDRAIDLCQSASIAEVSNGISISGQGLRNRIKSRKILPRSSDAFMEIPMRAVLDGTLTGSGNSRDGHGTVPMIELERRDGLKLRISYLPNDVSLKSLLIQFTGGQL